MKTQIILIQVDSVSDLITNSSTDIFGCQTAMTENAIRELLDNVAKAAGESAGCTVKTSTLRGFFDEIKWYAAYDLGIRVTDDLVFEKESDNYFTLWLAKYRHYFGHNANAKTKVILIRGKEDNSIPYWIQQFIEDRLTGLRYHLG